MSFSMRPLVVPCPGLAAFRGCELHALELRMTPSGYACSGVIFLWRRLARGNRR
jgi:hypothetical protein